jgi:hypothetical protein
VNKVWLTNINGVIDGEEGGSEGWSEGGRDRRVCCQKSPVTNEEKTLQVLCPTNSKGLRQGVR